MRLYDFAKSGNGYKIRLMLNHLQIAYERVELNIVEGETRTPEFLAKNPIGRIPTLELDDGTCLAESDAILFYLARDTDYLPADRLGQSQVLQWMFFEQYCHEPYIAVVRFWHFSGRAEAMQAEIPARTERGYQALGVMEQHLAANDFFVGGRYSIADIALYAYTHVAEEGRFDLARFPAILAWLDRVKSQPRHIPITQI